MVYLKLLATVFFWGGTFVAGRIIAPFITSFDAAFLRFLLASIVLVPLLTRSSSGFYIPKRSQWIAVALLGLSGIFFYNLFFFQGLHYIKAGRAALIIALNPVAITIFSAFLFKEKLNAIKILGIVFSVFGAVVVITRGNISELAGFQLGHGEMLILGCVVSWTSYSLIGKHTMKGMSPLAAVTWSTLAGTIFLSIPSLYLGVIEKVAEYPLSVWLSLLYLALFGTVAAFFWYYDGIYKIGAGKAAVFINFVPVFAGLLGYLFLGEILESTVLTGGLLVVVGVYLTNNGRIRPAFMNKIKAG